ncbi:hypothetical protein D9M68_720520 [compost metagenome]
MRQYLLVAYHSTSEIIAKYRFGNIICRRPQPTGNDNQVGSAKCIIQGFNNILFFISDRYLTNDFNINSTKGLGNIYRVRIEGLTDQQFVADGNDNSMTWHIAVFRDIKDKCRKTKNGFLNKKPLMCNHKSPYFLTKGIIAFLPFSAFSLMKY